MKYQHKPTKLVCNACKMLNKPTKLVISIKDNTNLQNSDVYAIVKLATVVKGNPKALFSIATTLRCKGGHYTFPWIALLYP